LDNLPFRLAVRGAEGWRELVVVPDGEGPGPPLDDVRLPPHCGDGARVPLQDAAADWLVQARRCAARVLVIDYGSVTAELADRPWLDWVRTYRGHGRGGHPLEAPGSQDVTCDVAWDQLPAPSGRWRQAAFLRRLGIDGLVEEGRHAWRMGAAGADLAALRGRSRVREAEALLDPTGLGGFDVLEWRAGSAQP
jgi:SAM-dependent MidA family methyltransferase